MTDSPAAPITRHLDCIKDPRRHNIRHLLCDMLLISLCAIISGTDSWTQVAEYGRSKVDWFRSFLALPNGIPSHDTFGRLFAMLDPKGFEDFFARWVEDLSESIKGKAVCIDGKTLRGSHDRANGKSAIHMVSAWVSRIGLVLGQLKTDAKSNEIIAIPELIKTLALEGTIVTLDAIGCQKEIARTIIEKKPTILSRSKTTRRPSVMISLFSSRIPPKPSTLLKPSMGSTGASKREITSWPTISIGFRENTFGPA